MHGRAIIGLVAVLSGSAPSKATDQTPMSRPAPLSEECLKPDGTAFANAIILSVAADHCWFMSVKKAEAEARISAFLEKAKCNALFFTMLSGVERQMRTNMKQTMTGEKGSESCQKARSIKLD